MGSSSPSGVLVVDKPRGPTSHDVVTRLRRALGTREVGHAGTLDPMATGVLVVAVGEATKLVPWLVDRAKVYETTLALGVETDTLDAEGRETRRMAPGELLLGALARSRDGVVDPLLQTALDAERRRTEQVPPAYSAIRQDGVRAHTRARKGEEVELAPRAVQVTRIEGVVCSSEPPAISLTLEVSKGYYVRAFARDLASQLGTVAHLTALRRTRSGCFDIDEAIALESSPEELLEHMQPLAEVAARALPVARLTEEGARHARSGRAVPPGDIEAPGEGPCAWMDPGGDLVAIGRIEEGGCGRVVRGFVPKGPGAPAS
jgi:tRNA pseudouridine55 synthase